MAYDFHYTPTGTGVISGKEVLEQTEDAINDLGNTAISGVQEALDKAEQALTNSENAVDDAQTALNTANNAEGVAIQAQTDVGNLSGTVTNIGNRVTTAEGNISNLQGRMTTAEGNITNLQGRMTTAESNIGNLQTAVSTAQATANSAQQTATTARQQSYVFRYSSTALTPSSTNSNTLLDNTDNLKVGDKVIDSNGVLFSITAIDTANSTFTIGTALIDLALDSDVVHKSGNETISGDKVFNNRLIKNIDVVLGTAPSTTKFGTIEIDDNNKSTLLQVMGGVYNNGQSYARFAIQNKTADDGTGLSPTGTLRGCGFNISLPATSTSDGQGSITPRANKTTDFGLSSYQWRNVWCEKLYLNGTQLDPSAFALDNAVVHLSGNETVGGQKTFTNSIILQNSDTSGVSRDLFSKSQVAVLGDVGSSDNTKYRFVDKNNNEICYIRQRKLTNSNTDMSFCVNNIDNDNNSISAEINFIIDRNNDPRISPSLTDFISLGRPTFRWKSIYSNSYYYGNVEFSTKFVTTDTNQAISGDKNFKGLITTEPDSTLWPATTNTTADITSLGGSSIHIEYKASGKLTDLSGGAWTVVELGEGCFFFRINNGTDIRFKHFPTNSVNRIPVVSNTNRQINSLTPETDNTYNLGDSTRRWSTINGLNPGALSLPDLNNGIDISSYITDITGASNINKYTPTVNGWISIGLSGADFIEIYIPASLMGATFTKSTMNSTSLAFMPVIANKEVKITLKGSSIGWAKFYPCQGNV